MPYFPPDIVARAKEMDLFTYLQNYDPQELVHVSGTEYTTRTHDSLRISTNGLWNWFSRGIGGKTALDYLIKVRGFSFLEAMDQIVNETKIRAPCNSAIPTKEKPKKPKTLLLPPLSDTADEAEKYLIGRGIDQTIIKDCIKNGQICESNFKTNQGRVYKNVVFIGHNDSGIPKYANIRGIGTDFKGDANGSDKHYSFRLEATKECDTLHLFEAPIDLLSYATLLKLSGRDYKDYHLLSLAGVYEPNKDINKIKIPVALEGFLKEHPNIKRIVLYFDNDRAGKRAAEALQTVLSNTYEIIIKLPQAGKDCNDFLQIQLGLFQTNELPRMQKAYER